MKHDSIQFDSPLPAVHAWQDAANRRDIDRVLELSDPEIKVAVPRGTGHGHQLLRDWLEHSRLTIQTTRAFVRGETVVLAQHATWQPGDNGEASGESDFASRFEVNDGRVTHFSRYHTLDDALVDAGLNATDEMKEF
jgi:hypothetical protein